MFENDQITRIVAKYNRSCPEQIKVDLDQVLRFKKVLKDSSRGTDLVKSLVYEPNWDYSVYVRQEQDDGHVVDVGLATHDVTWRSSATLATIRRAKGKEAGSDKDIGEVAQHLQPLSPIVKAAAQKHYVHAVRKFGKLFIVQTARRRVEGRQNVETMDLKTIPKSVQAYFSDGAVQARCSDKKDLHKRIALDSLGEEIAVAWLIHLTLMRKERSEEQLAEQMKAARSFLAKCMNDYEAGRMVEYVNYKTMFMSRGQLYRDGRLTWPVVLGLCTSKHGKDKARDSKNDFDECSNLTSKLGSYKGQYSWKNGVAILLSVLATLSLLFLILIFVLQEWSNATGAIVGVGLPALGGFMMCITYLLLKSKNPIDMLAYDKSMSPSMGTLEEATSILLPSYSQKTYRGDGLEFTGRDYSGEKDFAYEFTYNELFKMGFKRRCTLEGQECLLVPRCGTSPECMLRMKVEQGSDRFELVDDESPTFECLWNGKGKPGATGSDKNV